MPLDVFNEKKGKLTAITGTNHYVLEQAGQAWDCQGWGTAVAECNMDSGYYVEWLRGIRTLL